MKQLLIRADDVGYSYAVNLGIARSVREGLVGSVGVMPNMPETERGLAWVRQAAIEAGKTIAIGQHTNVCLGKPCANPDLIPSLLDEEGNFKSSKVFRQSFKDGVDFVDFDEALIEIEAQYVRFKELVGAEPDYFEAHAVLSNNLIQAITYVAQKHHLKEQPVSFDPHKTVLCGSTEVRMACEDMKLPDEYHPIDFIHRIVEGMSEKESYVLVFHPGYLDNFILSHSSLTINRTKEVDALIDPALSRWLKSKKDLRLIDYRDL